MTEPLIRLETEGPVATVTLARPEKLNALTAGMLAELEAIAAGLERRDDIRVVLLTGSGPKAFCAGADIADWGSYAPLDFGRHWVREGHRIFDRWARLRQPLVAVVNGIAFGGGLELAACADLRIAEAHARLGLPEARIGIIPGWSGTQRLVRRVGPSAVKRLAFTGEPVDAEEALHLGLVDYVRPTGEGMAFARTLAASIAERAPIAVQTAKQLVNAAEGEETAAAFEAIAGALAASTDDAAEGVAAFRDKRAATFTNR
jgi:enoyl-CoA hydratase/carnithine racemase